MPGTSQWKKNNHARGTGRTTPKCDRNAPSIREPARKCYRSTLLPTPLWLGTPCSHLDLTPHLASFSRIVHTQWFKNIILGHRHGSRTHPVLPRHIARHDRGFHQNGHSENEIGPHNYYSRGTKLVIIRIRQAHENIYIYIILYSWFFTRHNWSRLWFSSGVVG